MVGLIPAPFMGFYAASKHALEGYSESLDHEVRGFGVRALLVEPGFMKTRLDQNALHAAGSIEDYASARLRVEAGIQASVSSGDDPMLAATVIADAALASQPRLRYPVGKSAGTLAKLRSFLPAAMFDRSFRSAFHLDT